MPLKSKQKGVEEYFLKKYSVIIFQTWKTASYKFKKPCTFQTRAEQQLHFGKSQQDHRKPNADVKSFQGVGLQPSPGSFPGMTGNQPPSTQGRENPKNQAATPGWKVAVLKSKGNLHSGLVLGGSKMANDPTGHTSNACKEAWSGSRHAARRPRRCFQYQLLSPGCVPGAAPGTGKASRTPIPRPGQAAGGHWMPVSSSWVNGQSRLFDDFPNKGEIQDLFLLKKRRGEGGRLIAEFLREMIETRKQLHLKSAPRFLTVT